METHFTPQPHHLKEWMNTMLIIRFFHNSRALWLALVSAILHSGIITLGAIVPDTHQFETDFHIEYILITNLVLFVLLYLFNFWVIRCGLHSIKLALTCLLGSFGIATLCTLGFFHLEKLLYGSGSITDSITLDFIINGIAALIACLISLLLNNVTQQQQLALENERLQSENILTRYQTLQQQVSPHFLFNSLNTLDGLIGTDDSAAHNYLQQLAATFRYSMQDLKEVTLQQELDFTHSYIYMMQIRHGDNLHISEAISTQYLPLHLPPISLQLLVENAIKHNIVSQRHPLTITIQTLDPLPPSTIPMLRVSNPLQPKTDSERGSGVGLSNLALRYQLLFNTSISIRQTESEFIVEIPLIDSMQ